MNYDDTLLNWIILCFAFCMLVKTVHWFARQFSEPRYVCTSCHAKDRGDHSRMAGSGWITFILLCCYIVPGVLYWIWRRTRRQTVCGTCGHATLIPVASPVGRRLV